MKNPFTADRISKELAGIKVKRKVKQWKMEEVSTVRNLFVLSYLQPAVGLWSIAATWAHLSIKSNTIVNLFL